MDDAAAAQAQATASAVKEADTRASGVVWMMDDFAFLSAEQRARFYDEMPRLAPRETKE